MAIASFNFVKIKADKKKKPDGKVSIKNNVSIKEVNHDELPAATDDRQAARVIFEFTSKFEPDIGSIELESEVLVVENSEKIKAFVDTWNDKKSVPDEYVEKLFNLVLRKCNIKALTLADELKLPSPIQMGQVKMKKD